VQLKGSNSSRIPALRRTKVKFLIPGIDWSRSIFLSVAEVLHGDNFIQLGAAALACYGISLRSDAAAFLIGGIALFTFIYFLPPNKNN
jgi:hypothetical protein